MRVLEGQDHGRLVRFIIVRFYAEFARAGGRDFVLDDVLFARAREAREAPGGGRRERARYNEAARRHRSSGSVRFSTRRRRCSSIALATRSFCGGDMQHSRDLGVQLYALVMAQMPTRSAVEGTQLFFSTSTGV